MNQEEQTTDLQPGCGHELGFTLKAVVLEAEWCPSPPPQHLYVEILSLVPHNVTVFGDRTLKEVIQEK